MPPKTMRICARHYAKGTPFFTYVGRAKRTLIDCGMQRKAVRPMTKFKPNRAVLQVAAVSAVKGLATSD
jgi:hypothetical protein